MMGRLEKMMAQENPSPGDDKDIETLSKTV